MLTEITSLLLIDISHLQYCVLFVDLLDMNKALNNDDGDDV